MPQVRVLILRAPGANCDGEAQFAFEQAGAAAERVHVNRLREDPGQLKQYQVLCIPGGFTYGDDVAAGKILAIQLRSFLNDALQQFRADGKLILGICNGFQVLLKAGLLIEATPPTPPSQGGEHESSRMGQGETLSTPPLGKGDSLSIPPLGKGGLGGVATLAHNSSGKFEDRWIRMKANPGNCHFLQGCEFIEAPIAHGEGRFVCRDESALQALQSAGQVVLKYVDESGRSGPYPINPNGSQADVAGVCDLFGRVLGLMPHPERHVLPTQHPQWTRKSLGGPAVESDGLRLFHNAVRYFERW